MALLLQMQRKVEDAKDKHFYIQLFEELMLKHARRILTEGQKLSFETNSAENAKIVGKYIQEHCSDFEVEFSGANYSFEVSYPRKSQPFTIVALQRWNH